MPRSGCSSSELNASERTKRSGPWHERRPRARGEAGGDTSHVFLSSVSEALFKTDVLVSRYVQQ